MIELRWVEFGPNRQLEYRVLQGFMDASGALNLAGAEWCNWIAVPKISGDEAAFEDLVASGGYFHRRESDGT